jgi:Na+/alanine symporter
VSYVVDGVYRVIWIPLIAYLLIGVGLYLTVRTKGVQFRLFARICNLVAIARLSRLAIAALADYEAQGRSGATSPDFDALRLGPNLRGELDEHVWSGR